jgi:eukaryotic-like serine/threonine-protein kinase
MTPERWQEVKDLFADALEQRPGERAAYLDRFCADASLRQDVELMIAAHEQGGSGFMERPAMESNEVQKSGTKLGPYEILALAGTGGMGEVYRARDAKLGRDVALKVLPEAFARDADRMARFQREAKLLAALNHPNIATIHGLEDSGNTHALVMELVEGPTLADRLRSGPIPIDEALRIAKQMCDAIEYAHERGIVHRDLKPANVKVTNNDAVKILDFGLARAIEGDAVSADLGASPTISRMATQAGILLGTAAYMSPEQARGKTTDRRADIWAFGCVTYEMLTGKTAFPGESVTDALAAVIRAEPDWSQLPPATPIRIRVLLQRCLQKDPKQRLQAIGEARIAIDEVLSGTRDPTSAISAARPAKQWHLWLVSGVAGLFVLATALLAFLYFHQKAPAIQATRFEIALPEKFVPNTFFALSPDGRRLAFIGTGADGQSRLWVRSLETLEPQPLDGTEGAEDRPFWSPDSRFIAFYSQSKLKQIEVSGGPVLTLCDASGVWGGVWTGDKIVFGSHVGIRLVDASGGVSSPITTDEFASAPSLLPDGRHFIYLRELAPGVSGTGIYLGSVDAKPQEQSSKKLLDDDSLAVYTPSSDPAVGYVLFVRGASGNGARGTLMAQPFDTRRFELTGEAVPIAERVSNTSFWASGAGVLAYMTDPQATVLTGSRGNIWGQLTWFDRQGKALGAVGDSGLYRSLAISPNGKRVAFERVDLQNARSRNIWLYEFARGVTTRFTFDSSWDSNPVWSPDGSHIAFGSQRDGTFDLYQKASNLAGEDEPLFKSGLDKVPSSWSPDGRFLLYYFVNAPSEVWGLPLGGVARDRTPVRLMHSELDGRRARFSPDGRWIAYASSESGNSEIYVRPFDTSSAMGSSSAGGTAVTGKWMVSKDGGDSPLWRGDGEELFYLSRDGMAMTVAVSTGGVFQAGIPKALFKVPPGVLFWDVTADGKRFLMTAPSAAGVQAKFTVVLNWQAGLKK